MKFHINKVTQSCRLGILSEFSNAADKVIQTPACMMYTRGGHIPSLGADLIAKLKHNSGLVQMPLTYLAEHCEGIRNYEKGIHLFTGNPDSVVMSSLQDPVQARPTGYNDTKTSSIWTRHGRKKLNVEAYMKMQDAMMPDFYEALADFDTPDDSTKKRLQKAHDRSLNFLDECLAWHGKSDRLKNSAILGVIGGGHNVEDRIRSAKEVSKRPVQGFVVSGLHQFGPESEKFELASRQSILEKSLSQLPKDKPRFLHGILNPHNVISAVELGIDVIDSTYPYVAASRGCALQFDFRFPVNPPEESDEEQNTGYEMNLKDKKYFDDFSPLLRGCQCYTCSTHTRAYVNHLLNTGELLADILLMIHNLQHYSAFMEQVRQAISSERFDELKRIILAQKVESKNGEEENGGGDHAAQG